MTTANPSHVLGNRSIPIRSTWRDAIGKPLTDKRIAFYAAQGRYGEEWKQKMLDRAKKKQTTKRRTKADLLEMFC